MTTDAPDPFSRDRLAGNDPTVLHGGRVCILGAGAASQSIVFALALLGVGAVAVVDTDRFEAHNLTRSPFYLAGARKAPAVARGFLSYATALEPRAFAWVGLAEEVGDLVGAWANAVVSAVDTNSGRRYASDIARRYGVPLIEVGFDGRRGSVAVYPPHADGACWACGRVNTADSAARGLCSLYSRAVEESGAVPSVQTVAQVVGGLAAEAAVGALHARGHSVATRWTFDVGTWRAVAAELARDPACDGVHQSDPQNPLVLDCTPSRASELRAVVERLGPDPIITLPEPWVESLPCAECGRAVRIGAYRSTLRKPPVCAGACEALHRPALARVHSVLPWADRFSLRRFRVCPGSVLDVQFQDGRHQRVRLPGELEEVFKRFRRGTGRRSLHAPRR